MSTAEKENPDWLTRILSVDKSKVTFRHMIEERQLGKDVQSMETFRAYIDYGEGEPEPYKTYEVKRYGTTIGHAEFNRRKDNGEPFWEIDIFNLGASRGGC